MRNLWQADQGVAVNNAVLFDTLSGCCVSFIDIGRGFWEGGMSVRKRAWTTRKGEAKEAWILTYAVNGTRYQETFDRKKDADAREAQVAVDVGKGIHIAPSKSVTVAEAGELWIKACEGAELERATVDGYKQHLRLHINPLLGHHKLSTLTVPLMRKFKDDLRTDGRSSTRVRVVMASLGAMLADALERGPGGHQCRAQHEA